MTNMLTFTPARTKKLRKAYEAAVKRGDESFVFEGNPLVTNYAKYMLEHLDGTPNVKVEIHEARMNEADMEAIAESLEITLDDCKAEAEKAWDLLASQIPQGMPDFMTNTLASLAKTCFIAGCGWYRAETQTRAERVIELLQPTDSADAN